MTFNLHDLESNIANNSARMEAEEVLGKGSKASDQELFSVASGIATQIGATTQQLQQSNPIFIRNAEHDRTKELLEQVNGTANVAHQSAYTQMNQMGYPQQPVNYGGGYPQQPANYGGGYPPAGGAHMGQPMPLTPQEIAKAKERAEKAPKTLLPLKSIRHLGDNIKTKVFGQDLVINEIVNTLSVAALNIRINKDKPAGCYFLAGPSGCGKTELSQNLAKFLGVDGREVPFLKIDMGLFGMENDITKLIGPPPGYSGNKDGGTLTNFVMENPISVILFDEMEKAHESMDKIFLSILDKGVCTDGRGMKVLFKDTIILVTSNLGAEVEYRKDFTDAEKQEYRMAAIYENMRPEIINRFDSIFQCKALPEDVYGKIMNKFLGDLYANFSEEHQMTLTHTEKLLTWASHVSYDPAMGGRPARKFIEKIIIQPLAQSMVREEIDLEKNKNIILDLTDDGNVCFRDSETKEVLGQMEDTAALIKELQANKFEKGKTPAKSAQPSQDEIFQQLVAMSSETSEGSEMPAVIDAESEMLAQAPTTAKQRKPLPAAKINRQSSRKDFKPR